MKSLTGMRSLSRGVLRLGLLGTIVLLAGCAGRQLPADVAGGECKTFVRADYEILGKTRWDQAWIDNIIETGVASCGWPRPKVRPTNWDQAVVYANQVQATAPVVKKSVWQRVKQRFTRKKEVTQVPAVQRPVVPRSRPPEAPAPTVRSYEPTPLLMQPVQPPQVRVVPERKPEGIDQLLSK